MANPLLDVQKFGQSIWYDNVRRGLITSGEPSGVYPMDDMEVLRLNTDVAERIGRD